MNYKILTGFIILCIIVIGVYFFKFSQIKNSKEAEYEPEIEVNNVNNIVDANNRFCLDYYSQLKDKEKNNIFFSPFSISSAFAMVYEGANGDTAKEMQSVFYFPQDKNVIRKEYQAILDELNKTNKQYELNSANALWVNREYQFSKDYFNIIDEYYNGKVANLDFSNSLDNSVNTINKWIEDHTNNKINNSISSSDINSSTSLVLTNAIYFKGNWDKQFNKSNTQKDDFRISKDEVEKVDMMHMTDKDSIFNYFENDDIQILEMPYSGNELSALFLLPKDNDLSRLENIINVNKLSEWRNSLLKQRVDVYIPKFKFGTRYSMASDLNKMGMQIAFSDLADFSGMSASNTKDFKIDQAVHQAFIEVNEDGTEAAAATSVIMMPTSVMPQEDIIPIFKADHPFIFIIQQKDNGNILFIGRVINPKIE